MTIILKWSNKQQTFGIFLSVAKLIDILRNSIVIFYWESKKCEVTWVLKDGRKVDGHWDKVTVLGNCTKFPGHHQLILIQYYP